MKTTIFPIAVILLAWGCSSDIGDDAGRDGSTKSEVLLAAPASLVGQAQSGGTQILLTWSDTSIGETGFRVDVSDHPIVVLSDVQTFFLVASGVTTFLYQTSPGTIRYFRVLAVTDTLESDPSEVISVSTANVPAAPTLIATLTSPVQILLQWSDSYADETGYRIERSQDGGAGWIPLISLSANIISHTDGSLLPDTLYCYRVFTSNSEGESAPSNVACQLTPSTAFEISSPSVGGKFTSIVLDGAGREHISHYDPSSTNILYTTNAGGPFSTVTADSGPLAGSTVGSDGTSIAIEPRGVVHVAGFHAEDQDLRVSSGSPASMTASTVDSVGVIGGIPRIARSSADASIQVLYRGGGTSTQFLRRRIQTGPTFMVETVVSGEWIPASSFVLDGIGNPHIAYLEVLGGGASYRLMYGVKQGSGVWSFSQVASPTGFVQGSVAIDGSGEPHVVYGAYGVLYHASRVGGVWSSEVVHQEAGVWAGGSNALAIDVGTGRLHVAYNDLTSGDLLYAQKALGGAWARKRVDTSGSVGEHCSIAVEGAGIVHFAYYDATTQRLKRASGSP